MTAGALDDDLALELAEALGWLRIRGMPIDLGVDDLLTPDGMLVVLAEMERRGYGWHAHGGGDQPCEVEIYRPFERDI